MTNCIYYEKKNCRVALFFISSTFFPIPVFHFLKSCLIFPSRSFLALPSSQPVSLFSLQLIVSPAWQSVESVVNVGENEKQDCFVCL